MSERSMMSRRTALWMGIGAFGVGVPFTLLTTSDADAQTPGMDRRQDRRDNRKDRREDRRDNRKDRRDDRQDRRDDRRKETTGQTQK